MRVTAAFLYAIAPGADGKIVDAIVSCAERINVTDPTELAYFMGQNAAETGGFTRLEENLYYTSTKRLREVWPTRFKSDGAAAKYTRNPQALANLVYGGRFGNRPVPANDGWDYRGSGLNQTTFLDNYARVQAEAGIQCVAKPELLRSFPGAVDAASTYWKLHNLARFAKAGDLIGLTKSIQGADGGLRDRKVFTDRALAFIKRPVSDKAPQTATRTDWLRKGASGPAVTSLQTKLKLAGFYVGGVLDGNFGDGTDNAVRDFQKANGLIVDGVVGDKTATTLDNKINSGLPPASASPSASATVPGASGLAAIFAALARIVAAIFNKGKKDGKS